MTTRAVKKAKSPPVRRRRPHTVIPPGDPHRARGERVAEEELGPQRRRQGEGLRTVARGDGATVEVELLRGAPGANDPPKTSTVSATSAAPSPDEDGGAGAPARMDHVGIDQPRHPEREAEQADRGLVRKHERRRAGEEHRPGGDGPHRPARGSPRSRTHTAPRKPTTDTVPGLARGGSSTP